MKEKSNDHLFNRRRFVQLTGIGAGAGLLGLQQISCSGGKKTDKPAIQGFEESVEEDPSKALNMTAGGIVAHQSALKGGEWMKIPQYRF
jgi:hypothetical protein